MSTPGIDIFSLKDNKALFLELKSHKTLTNTLQRDALIQFKENYKIVNNFISKTNYTKKRVGYFCVIFERNNFLRFYDMNDKYIHKPKTNKVNINNFLIESFTEVLKEYGL